MCSYNITVIVPPTLMQAKTGPKQKPVPGGGGYCHIWAIWVCATVKGRKVWFSNSLLLDKVYKSERLRLE